MTNIIPFRRKSPPSSEDEARLLAAFRKLSPALRDALLIVVEADQPEEPNLEAEHD